MAVAFFRREAGAISGSKEVVLTTEMKTDATGATVPASHVVLKLDFDVWSWKRVRRKVS